MGLQITTAISDRVATMLQAWPEIVADGRLQVVRLTDRKKARLDQRIEVHTVDAPNPGWAATPILISDRVEIAIAAITSKANDPDAVKVATIAGYISSCIAGSDIVGRLSGGGIDVFPNSVRHRGERETPTRDLNVIEIGLSLAAKPTGA